MQDLNDHQYSYLNKTLTLRATIAKSRHLDGSTSYKIMQYEPMIIVICTFTKNVDTSSLINGVEYYFTGIYKLHTGYNEYGYLEVSKVEGVS
jgi:hypothetical protein